MSHFLAGRLRTQLAYEHLKGVIERTELRFPETALFCADAFFRNFSGYIHAFADNSTSVDVCGHLRGVFGAPNRFVSIPIGQMHMLQ